MVYKKGKARWDKTDKNSINDLQKAIINFSYYYILVFHQPLCYYHWLVHYHQMTHYHILGFYY